VAEIIINSDRALSEGLGIVRAAYEESKFIRLIVRKRVRSLNQNDQAYVWYEQIGLELSDHTALEARCISKLVEGVPILRSIDSEFREFYDRAIKWMTYEEKIEAMKFVPVTSRLPVDAMSQYLEAMQRLWAKRDVTLRFLETGKNKQKVKTK
jgi:hypothetical protein